MIKVIGWRADEHEQRQIIELKNVLSVKADSQIIRMAVADLHKKIFSQSVDISTMSRFSVSQSNHRATLPPTESKPAKSSVKK